MMIPSHDITIALSSLFVLKKQIKISSAEYAFDLLEELKQVADGILKATDHPFVKNTLSFIFFDLPKKDLIHTAKELCDRIDSCVSFLDMIETKIAFNAQSVIKNGSTVFVHGFSSSVIKALILAKQLGKRFSVKVAESRPLMDGRKAALMLAKEDIDVSLHIDSTIGKCLKESDVCFLSAERLTKEGIYGPTGVSLMASTAEMLHVPVYFFVNSWTHDDQIRNDVIGELDSEDIWPNLMADIAAKSHRHEAFIPEKNFFFISELGLHDYSNLIKEADLTYPWLMN